MANASISTKVVSPANNEELRKARKRKRDHEAYCRKIALRDGITQEEVHAQIVAERKRALDRYYYCRKVAEKKGISMDEARAVIQANKRSFK